MIDAHPRSPRRSSSASRTEVAGEETVKAVVVPQRGLRGGELIAFCRERLANFKVPAGVEFREEIPKSPLGKVLRKYLV